MKYASYLLAALLALSPVAAFAKGGACYTPAQMQAEQLLRLHSELMVITVTCATGSNGESLPAAYGDFTKKHITVLHDAEQTMMSYYKSTGKGNAQDRLDKLRTILANEIGQKSANMTAPVFCAQYRDKVVKLDAASGADVQNEVQRMLITERSYAPSCTAGTAKVKY